MANPEYLIDSSRRFPTGRYVVFSDIHGEIETLERLFDVTKTMRKDGYFCLGDVVHRGKEYREDQCVHLVREKADLCLRGNHDEDAVSLADSKLTDFHKQYLSALRPYEVVSDAIFFHSSIVEYNRRIHEPCQALEEIAHINGHFPDVRVGFFGHTHRPGAFSHAGALSGKNLVLDPCELHLLNPGALADNYGGGQSFLVFDFDRYTASFLTLQEAEDMTYLAKVVNTFDQRWMPALNSDSYQFFAEYVQEDLPIIEGAAKRYPGLDAVSGVLGQFDPDKIVDANPARVKKYLEDYSGILANSLDCFSEVVAPHFDIVPPHQSRADYLKLPRATRA